MNITEGIYENKFQLGKDFVDEFIDNSFLDLKVDVYVTLNKTRNISFIDVEIEGELEVECDRCLDILTYPIYSEERAIIKANSNTEQDEDVNVLYYNGADAELDCSQFIYESILLSIPPKITHDDIDDESKVCNENLLKYYSLNNEDSNENVDNRWAELKKLK